MNAFDSVTSFFEKDGALYKIIRMIKKDSSIDIDKWKKRLNADILFKKNGFYYFAQLVPEAEVIEEITFEEMKKIEDTKMEIVEIVEIEKTEEHVS